MFAAIAYKMNQDNLTPIENADLEKAVENMLCLYLTRLEQLTGIVKALYTVNGAIIPDNLIHLKDGKISDIKGTECYLEYEGGLMDALKKELGVPVGGQMMMQITELKDRLTDLARNDMPAEYKIDRLWATNGYDRLMHLLTGYDCGTIIRFMFSHNQLLSDEIFNIAKTEITPDNEHFDVNKQRELSGKRLQNTYKM